MNALPIHLLESTEPLKARKLTGDDCDAFRFMRLHALRTEGEFFGPTYEEEKEFPKDKWIERTTETDDRCYFGLFDTSRGNPGVLIGASLVRQFDHDPTGKTASWEGTYLFPEYRGEKLMVDLYQQRLQWTQRHPIYKYATLFIRQDNKRSIEIHEKHGAKLIDTREMTWPGRMPKHWNWYSYDIEKG